MQHTETGRSGGKSGTTPQLRSGPITRQPRSRKARVCRPGFNTLQAGLLRGAGGDPPAPRSSPPAAAWRPPRPGGPLAQRLRRGDAQLRRGRPDGRIPGHIFAAALHHQAHARSRGSLGYGFSMKIILPRMEVSTEPGAVHWEQAPVRYTKLGIPEADQMRPQLTAKTGVRPPPPRPRLRCGRPPGRRSARRIAAQLSCQAAPSGARLPGVSCARERIHGPVVLPGILESAGESSWPFPVRSR
jgi:hypothetical protein